MTKYFLLLLPCLLLFACGENETSQTTAADECPFGEPVPLFKQEMSLVDSTAFSKDGRTGTEIVFFNNQIHLELTQSGCENLRQEFAFTLPMSRPEAEGRFWIAQGEQLLRFLGNVDLSLVQFNEWANVIAQNADDMKLGEAKEVQTGYFITADKIARGEETTVKVVLESR